MKKNAAIALAIVCLPTASFAGGAWGGALGGISQAGQNIGQQLLEAGLREDEMKRQHEYELERERERLRQQYELERLERERQQRQAELEEKKRLADEQARQRNVDVLNKVEAAHPGWKQLVRTQKFSTWLNSQPQEIQAWASSPEPDVAIALLDRYERDTATKGKNKRAASSCKSKYEEGLIKAANCM